MVGRCSSCFKIHDSAKIVLWPKPRLSKVTGACQVRRLYCVQVGTCIFSNYVFSPLCSVLTQNSTIYIPEDGSFTAFFMDVMIQGLSHKAQSVMDSSAIAVLMTHICRSVYLPM